MRNTTSEIRAHFLSNSKKKHCQTIQRVNNSTRKKAKIMITGDNHVTICATELQQNLGVTLEVSSFANQVLE
jgi:hypothetical protein